MVSSENDCAVSLPRLIAGTYPPIAAYDADIIILTRNRFQDTVDAVCSAIRQLNIRHHVSVLDQGSDAGVQAAFAKAFKNHENFGYHVIDRNIGVGGGRNFLSSLGNGRVIIALDNDAIFADDLVTFRAVRAFGATPALGVLGFKIFSRDGILLDEFSWGYPALLKKNANELFMTTTFVGAGHAVRRTTWVAVGGYDADLFFTWEEYDLCLRAIALSWLIKCDGSLAVIHKISPEARVEWSSERMRLYVRNRLILARKWQLPWLSLTPRICVYILKAARNKSLWPALAGLFAAINQDRSLFKRRMNTHMRHYIYRNETSFRKNPLKSFYHRISMKTHLNS